MKTKITLIALLLIGALFTTSCEKKPTPTPPDPEPKTVGAWILNNGNFGSNDASMGLYDPKTLTYTQNVFEKLNGKKLGDTAQDIIIYGGKMYIAVYNSKMIFVTDKSGKIIKEHTYSIDGTTNLSPRMFTTYKGRVFVSYYEGYVGEIDTLNYNTKVVKVGDNPEGIVAMKDSIYVANSGGMSPKGFGHTISVVDPAKMVVSRDIEVNYNPVHLAKSQYDELFIVTNGDYTPAHPATFQRFSHITNKVDDITDVTATFMAMGSDDLLYVVEKKYDEKWNATCDYIIYNTYAHRTMGKFVKDGTKVENALSISVDPISGDIYIGTSDYISNGDMYVFSATGNLINKFDTQGLNPLKAIFVTEQ